MQPSLATVSTDRAAPSLGAIRFVPEGSVSDAARAYEGAGFVVAEAFLSPSRLLKDGV